jgi:hypothetical protein
MIGGVSDTSPSPAHGPRNAPRTGAANQPADAADPTDAAPVITCDVPGTFAWSVLHERDTALLARVRDATPYGPRQRAALDELAAAIVSDEPMPPLPDSAPDAAAWRAWREPVGDRSFAAAPFLWSESYFYRRLLHAVDYLTPGDAYQGIDPFAPFKDAELHGDATRGTLAGLDELAAADPRTRDAALLRAALWGNRADLGFQLLAGDTSDAGSRLLADAGPRLWRLLDAAPAGPVCVVADNAATELLADLALIDHLLTSGRASRVELHLKPYPYYVSDATTHDLLACLSLLADAGGAAARLAERLHHAIATGRLLPYTHDFYRAPLSYHDLPTDLAARFAGATLTLLKGDLNYRRLIGDRLWPVTASFDALAGYFPGPVACLRTLKSDVVVGLTESTVAALEHTEPDWRTSGRHALLQLRA